MKILFIGNSHTFFNDMPEMLRQLGASAGYVIDPVQNTSGGMGLDWHAKEYDVRYNILFGRYDYIVLQHVSHPFPGPKQLFDGAAKILKFIEMTSAKAILYMGWSEQKYPEKQPEQTEAWRSLSREYGLELAPVGQVWDYIRHTRPDIRLYYIDGEHASPIGSYLIACVFLCVLTGKPIESLPCRIQYDAPSFDGLHEDFYSGASGHTFDPAQCHAIWEAVNKIVAKRV